MAAGLYAPRGVKMARELEGPVTKVSSTQITIGSIITTLYYYYLK